MRITIYTLLTTLIILLAKLRKHSGVKWDFRMERDQPLVKAKNLDILNYKEGEQPHNQNRLECCDCGLTHGLYIDGKGFLRAVPWRPGNYSYKLRCGR